MIQANEKETTINMPKCNINILLNTYNSDGPNKYNVNIKKQ